MADMSVQGINDLMSSIRTDYPSSIAQAKGAKATAKDGQSFDDVMATGFSAVLNAFPANQVTEPNRVNDLVNKVSSSTTVDKTATVKVNDNVRNLKEKTTEAALEDAVHEAGQEMIRKTSEVLNVSEETVTNAMETLSMTEADLLNPENLSTLTMEITGITDSTELLTNDALYQDLQQLMDTASELTAALLEQFDLSDIQLTTAIENLSAGLNMDLMQVAMINPEVAIDNPVAARVEALDTSPRVAVNVDEEGDMVMQEEELMQESAGQNLRTTVEQTPDNSQTGADTGRREAEDEDSVEFTGALEQVTSRLSDAVQETFNNQAAQEAMPEPQVNPEDIMRQITDFMRVEVKPDVTTMELALHPQSLGHVIVQVTEAADGQMAARFLTQNEVVREALEQQMAELQQRFDEQGLKVTEITVTVESHAFDQNLQQGAGNPNPEGNADQASRPARPRRISLDDDELTIEGIDGMSEAEILAADMMARSGNRLDYQA